MEETDDVADPARDIEFVGLGALSGCLEFFLR